MSPYNVGRGVATACITALTFCCFAILQIMLFIPSRLLKVGASVCGLRLIATSPIKPNMGNEDYKNAKSVYDFTVTDIKGQNVTLDKYKGHVLIIVNVASQCGLTATNYKELAELDKEYRESKGLRILGFPCNQFGHQEPGTNDDIVCFVGERNVKFDMFDKVDVNGDTAHPLFKYLKHAQGGTFGDSIKWNFTKFIIDKNGQPVARFAPTTPPKDLVKTLEKYW